MNESELRELLKLIRGVEHYIEKCLRTEQEKNEDRVKKQLKNAGVSVTESGRTIYKPTKEVKECLDLCKEGCILSGICIKHQFKFAEPYVPVTSPMDGFEL